MSDGENNIIDLSPARIARMKNLKPYRDKTDEEIIALLRAKQTTNSGRKKRSDWTKLYNEKFELLKTEFFVDMNNSNDVENLKALVRQQIQLERIDQDIDEMQSKDHLTLDDYKNLKALGDLQRATVTSMNDFQDKLGISRKLRKEKQVDDIPQWISGILKKADAFYERKTTKIDCPRCKIELGRFWLNFRDLNNEIQLSLECQKCGEQIQYIQLGEVNDRGKVN